jgi:hypothetical protein
MRVIALFLVCLLSGCASFSSQQGEVQHVVLVWFKQGIQDSYIDLVSEETKRLFDIPGVETLHVGRAIESERPMVDDSFDLGVTMTFESEAAMQRYISHPKHKAFLEKYIRGKAEQVRIYDYAPR